MEFIGLGLSCIIGAIIAWLIVKIKSQNNYIKLDKDFSSYQAVTEDKLKQLNELITKTSDELLYSHQTISLANDEKIRLNNLLATSQANLNMNEKFIAIQTTEIKELQSERKQLVDKIAKLQEYCATVTAKNTALSEQMIAQKQDLENLNRKFNQEFENIANQILENKSAKFTEINKINLTNILEPLGQNIQEFKKKVEDSYNNESKERFSLGQKVTELAELNKQISQEAHNLTQALKSDSKIQGCWGEMILESILERSGLRKDEQYFMEHQLTDEFGNPIRSDSENKKMRPDAVIQYPDNRHVIIDSKVSLNAFTRYLAANNEISQTQELNAHISAIKNHIITLSEKGYDDYNKALDFVMMFIPSEPAYIAALQGDPNLWSFAYEKRILLISPTNLITSLKRIVDLWKRELQNQNAQQIAERGAKLYDKFVGFVENLEAIGNSLDKAQVSYQKAFNQLNSGNDNLVTQATKLKDLGVKNKKELKIKSITLDNE